VDCRSVVRSQSAFSWTQWRVDGCSCHVISVAQAQSACPACLDVTSRGDKPGHQHWHAKCDELVTSVLDDGEGNRLNADDGLVHSVVVNAMVSINEVALLRARLLLGWVTVCRQVNHLGI